MWSGERVACRACGWSSPSRSVITRFVSVFVALPMLWAASLATAQEPRFNPTGRLIELQVPLSLNQRVVGNILLAIEKDDSLSMVGSGLRALLTDTLAPEILSAVAAAEVAGRLTPASLEAAGLTTRFDSSSLTLHVDVPIDALKRRSLSLDRRRGAATDSVSAETNSAFLNLGFAVLQDAYDDGVTRADSEPRYLVEMDGLARFGGPVLAYEMTHRTDPDAKLRLSRRSTALLLDFTGISTRATLGDQTYLGRGLQRSVGLLGLGLGRDFAISGGGDVRVSGRRSIELAQASTVQVLVRDRPLATFDLSPGSYDLEDIPLASGANDVVLLIEDDAGRVSRIEFTELYDSALLPVGRYDHALALGILSRFGTEEPVYVDERPLLNGFLRRGLTGGATVGANIEASSDVWRLGTEWLQATRFGPVDMFAAVSEGGRRESGYAAGAEFSTAPGVSVTPGSGRFNFRAVARSAAFVSAGDALVGNAELSLNTDLVGTTRAGSLVESEDISLTGGYGVRLKSRTSLGLGVALTRSDGSTRVGSSIALSGRVASLSRLRWAVRARYISRDDLDDTADLEFALSWQFDDQSRISASHASNGAVTTLGFNRYSGGNAVGSHGVGLTVTESPDARQGIEASLSRAFNRGDAFASFRGSRIDTFDARSTDPALPIDAGDNGTGSDDLQTASAVVRFDTSIGIAGRSVAVGRRIDQGFAIVSAHPSLEDRPVLINAREGQYATRTSALGPALVNSPSPYRAGRIHYKVNDLPLGQDIGNGYFSTQAPFGAGFRLQVGSAAQITVVGTLLDEASGEAMGLMTGHAVSLDDSEAKPIQFFTNRTGKFAIPSLSSGRYELVVDTEPERRKPLTIPEDAENLYRVLEVTVP